jgi:hypothetical protein
MSNSDLSARNNRLMCSICGTEYNRPFEARQCERSGHPNRTPWIPPQFPAPPDETVVVGPPQPPPVAPVPMTDSAEVMELKTTIKILAQQLAEAQAGK